MAGPDAMGETYQPEIVRRMEETTGSWAHGCFLSLTTSKDRSLTSAL